MKKIIGLRLVVVPVGLALAAAVSVPAAATTLIPEPPKATGPQVPAEGPHIQTVPELPTQALGGLFGVPADVLVNGLLAGQAQDTTLAWQWQRSLDRVKHCTIDGCATDRAYHSQKGHGFEIMDTDARNARRPWEGWKLHDSPNAPGTDAVSRNGAQIQHKASSSPALQQKGVESCKAAGPTCMVVVPRGDAAQPGVIESKVSQKRIVNASTAKAVAGSGPELLLRGGALGTAFGCVVPGVEDTPKVLSGQLTLENAGVRIIEECFKGGLAGVAATGATIMLTTAAFPEVVAIAIAAGTGLVTYSLGDQVIAMAKLVGGKVVEFVGDVWDEGRKLWNHVFGNTDAPTPKLVIVVNELPRPHGPNHARLI